MTLKQNYDASVRYFNDFKQLNSGKGIFQNIAAQIKTAQTKELNSMQQQINQTFTQTYNSSTAVDRQKEKMRTDMLSKTELSPRLLRKWE